MLSWLLICLTAAGASLLTFYSGFGLGTLLAPVFALFFPIEIAIALTGAVHFFNNLFKLALVGRHADRQTLWRFGGPAILAAFAGAWLLGRLSETPALKVVIGVLIVAFALWEVIPALKNLRIDEKYLPVGGLLSGFFGGLSGHQGALRSAFLVRTGLSKEAFIATGVVIACFVDVIRLGVYAKMFSRELWIENSGLLVAATVSAAAGAYLGSRLLKKITIETIQGLVAVLLALIGIALAAGLI